VIDDNAINKILSTTPIVLSGNKEGRINEAERRHRSSNGKMNSEAESGMMMGKARKI